MQHFYIGDAQEVLHAVPVEDDGAELVGATHRQPRRSAMVTSRPSRDEIGQCDEHAGTPQKEYARCQRHHSQQAIVAEADMAGGGSSGHDSTDDGVDASKPATRGHNEEVSDQLQSSDPSSSAARVWDAQGPEACAGLASPEKTAGEPVTAHHHHHQRDKLQCSDPSGHPTPQDGGMLLPKQERWADMSSESDAEPKKDSSEPEELGDGAQAAQPAPPASEVKNSSENDAFQHARRRRKPRRRGRAKDAATSSTAAASTSAATQVMSTEVEDTQVMSTEFHQGVAERNWVHRFLCDALDHAERGDLDEAVAALARVLIPDSDAQLTIEQLFAVEQQRVRGGWQAKVCMANGREFVGRIKATPSSASSDAKEVVIDYLLKFTNRVVEGVRASLDSPAGRAAD